MIYNAIAPEFTVTHPLFGEVHIAALEALAGVDEVHLFVTTERKFFNYNGVEMGLDLFLNSKLEPVQHHHHTALRWGVLRKNDKTGYGQRLLNQATDKQWREIIPEVVTLVNKFLADHPWYLLSARRAMWLNKERRARRILDNYRQKVVEAEVALNLLVEQEVPGLLTTGEGFVIMDGVAVRKNVVT